MDTNVTTPQAVATVIAIEGQAFARDPSGQMRPLKAGDVLLEGDTVVTMPGGQVQLAFTDGQILTLLPNENFHFSAETSPGTRPEVAEAALPAGEADRIIQALERGEDIDDLLDPTAAGLQGSGESGGSSFVRLLRIAEGVGSTSFEFESADAATLVPADQTEGLSAVAPVGAASNTPPVSNPDTVTVNEDATVTINVLANDTDADGDVLTVISASANNGIAVINPDGTITYTPNPDYNGPDSITYTISDGQGGTATTTVNVTVTPVNDPAIIAGQDSGAVTEDTTLSTSGTLTVTDVDSGEASFTTQNTNGAYGSFALDASGNWTYSLDNANATVQALGADQTLIETFTVASVDGTTSSVTVTINGTNDAAVISSGTGSVTEDSVLSTSGSLSITDVDSGEASFTAQPGTNGAYGSFVMGTNGAWTYSLDNANAAVQALGAGDTLTESFTVASVDGTTNTVTITINGTNDAAVISSGTGSVTEDSTLTTGGTLTVTDTDSGEASFVAQPSTTGTYGTFAINSAGAWSYSLDNANAAVQALGAGQTLTETFTVASVDGTTSSVAITVNGTNDAAVISSGTGSVTEDGLLTTAGTLLITDMDSGEASFVAQPSTAGTYGSFALNASGNWTYALDNANVTVQALGAGQTLTETFTVASVDGTTSSVTVTINGTNDAAVISSGTGSVTEDGVLSTSGSLTISDVDSGEASFVAQPSTAGTYGSFILDASGNWTYALDNANATVQALGQGDTLSETFTVASVDGTTSTVTVTLNGTNDAAVISSGTGSVTEDMVLSTSGTLTVVDADAGESAFQPQTGSGTYGSFTINATGAWTYSLNNNDPAVQALANGDAVTETFTVLTVDGTSTSVTITVNGTNETFSGDTTGSVQEDTTLAASGALLASGGASFVPASLAGTYGNLTLDASGNWTYSLNNADANVQGLTTVDTRTEVFTVSLNDGTTGNLVVTVLGLDDMAIIAGQDSGAVTEDTTLSTSGTLTVTDVDSGEASFTAQPSTAGAYGSFTLDASGNWTYALDNANAIVQALGAGDTLTETFMVASVDGTTSTVTVTVNGTNDAAVISSGTGSVTEDSVLSTSGSLSISDVDDGETSFTAQPSTAGIYGSFTLDASGNWTYALDNANATVQALGAGGTLTETFTVASVDGTTSSVTITINGTNDVAVISSGTGSVTEDSVLFTSGTLSITDVDSGEASFTAQNTNGAYGSFTLSTNGAWTYTLNNSNPAVQALGTGQTLTETFTVASLDGTTSTVTVNVNGTNDAAVISSGTGSVTEDTTLTTSGTLTISDVDAGQASFTAQPPTAGTYGTFAINSAGAWSYSLDNTNVIIQALGDGDTLIETFTVSSVDGTTSTVTVTINGTNDIPVVSSGVGAVTEDTVLTTSGTLTVVDADAGESSFQPLSSAGTYGSFTINEAGAWTYTLNNNDPAVQALVGGDAVTETFTVLTADGTSTTVTVTVNGTNESFGGDTTGSVQEDTTTAASGALSASGGASFVATSLAGTYGSLTLDASGNWTYSLNNAAAAVQGLTSTDTYNEVFTVSLNDGTIGNLVITVLGLDDLAIIAGQNIGAVTEDMTLSTSGTLTVVDADADQASFTAQNTNGAYGSFTLDASGNWTYALDNTNATVQALGAGGALTETFTVASVDGTTSTVTVTINGTNDAAVISSGTGSVTEDGTLTTGGSLTITDVDSGEASFTVQPSTAGAYGSFTLDAAGNWTYSLDNANTTVQALGAGQMLTETFTVSSVDGTSSSVTVTINGTNDAAVISSGTGSVTEDGTLSTSGTLTITDVDSGEASFTAQPSTAGAYGSFTLDASGNWTYVLDNANAAVQALGQGDTLTETFTVASVDGTTSSVTVTINGTNDAAVISSGTGSVTEDSVLTTGGTLSITDVDSGEASFVGQPSTAGVYGAFTLDASSNWTYSLDNANATVQALGAGQTLTETFTVASVDGTTSSVTVTINGTNDAAVISSGTGSVTEDSVLSTSGTLSITDVDSGEASFTAQNTNGAYGSFTINAAGAWTYTLNNNDPAVQALSDGDAVTETFTVASVDGTTSSVTITVNGTNETISGDTTGSVQEDTTLAASGTLTATGGASFVPDSFTGTYGSLTLDASGNWTYSLNNADAIVQGLTSADTYNEVFTVSLNDGTTGNLVVTVLGLDDLAIIAGLATGSVTEDVAVAGGLISTSGALTVSDPDDGEAAFQPQTTGGTYGSFTLNADGNWNYSADNSNPVIQALGAGQTLTETFTVASIDGTTSSVTVTINGTNDAAVISSGTGSVTEDSTLTTGGILTITDVDSGEASFVAQPSTAGIYGSFTLDTSGNWTYALDNANATVQALGQGDTLTETFTVSSVDGTTSSVTVTINGTNDAAVISSGTGSVTEDSVLTTGGTLSITDVDSGEAGFVGQPATAGAYGSFTLDASGNWTYALDNANTTVQALGQGDTLTETFTVASVDGTTSSVMVTINGTNDAAVISSGTGSVTEDSVLTTGGTLSITDVDSGEAGFVGQPATAGAYGSFTLDASGNWTYVLDNANAAVQALGQGDTLTETFTVASVDGTTSSVTVTINGTNDAAVISSGTGSVTEDDTLTTGGTLSITDVDSGEASFTAQNTNGAYGSFTINAAGAWTYSLDNAMVQALGAGQTLTETFTVASIDGTSSSVTVTINGTNDAAVISSGSGSVTEDGTLTTDGTLAITDVDSGEASFTAQSTNGAYGSFTLDASGNWTYSLDNANAAVQALGQGDTLTETFTVASVDGTTSSVTVTINGTNDAAVISSGTGSVTEDSVLTTGGTLIITDVDSGEASFVGQPSTAGTYGSFTLGTNGAWTYALNNANPTVQALGAGDTLSEAFTVASVDGTTSTVTVTINGTNDAPLAIADVASVSEDSIVTRTAATGVLSNDTDVDAGDTKAVSAVAFGATSGTVGSALNGNFGTLTLNADGSYSYVANSPAAQALARGQVTTDAFTYTVRDTTGATSSTTLTFTITGTNDAPVAVADVATAVEAGGVNNATAGTNPSGNVLANDTDVDAGDTKSVSAVAFGATSGALGSGLNGSYGTLTLNADGTYSYVVNNGNATVQALNAGQSLTEVFTYTMRDAAGTTSSSTLTVTIQGTNDAPVVGTATATVSEEGLPKSNPDTTGSTDTTNSPTASGTLSITDVDSSAFTVTLTAPTGLTSGGQAITWAGSGTNTLVGSAGGQTILTATIANNGAYTVTLSGPIDHAVAGAEDVQSFGIGVSVSDGLSTTTSTLTVNVEDDSPMIGTPMRALMLKDAGASAIGRLELSIGADQAGALAQFSATNGISVDANGHILTTLMSQTGTASGTSYLTYNGGKLHYVSASDGSLTAVSSNGTAVFSISGDPLSGQYRVTNHVSLDGALLTLQDFKISGGMSGVFQLGDGSSFELLATATNNGVEASVNTSANSFGVGKMQAIDHGEILSFQFRDVTTAAPTTMASAAFTTDKLNDGESLTWSAYAANGALLGSGTVAGNSSGAVSFAVTSAQLGGAEFSSISFGAANGSSYKLVIDSIIGHTQLYDQAIRLDVNGVDGDGDTSSTQSLNIIFDSGTTLLTAGTTPAAIGGGSGNDTLTGSSGDDMISGGAGNDTLFGGLGADTFIWGLADKGTSTTPAIDTIKDFDTVANSDKLDLRDLLVGESHAGTDAGNLADYLHFTFNAGTNTTTLAVKSNGASTSAPDQLIQLEGVDLVGSFTSDQQIIQNLFSQGKLITD